MYIQIFNKQFKLYYGFKLEVCAYKLNPRYFETHSTSFLISSFLIQYLHTLQISIDDDKGSILHEAERFAEKSVVQYVQTSCNVRPRAKDAKLDRVERKRSVSCMTRSTLCKISRANNYLPLLLRESGQLVADNRIRNTRVSV